MTNVILNISSESSENINVKRSGIKVFSPLQSSFDEYKSFRNLIGHRNDLEINDPSRSLKYTRKLEERIFLILSELLNNVNQVNHDHYFWRVLLGHWLRRATLLFFCRLKSIEYFTSAFDSFDYASADKINITDFHPLDSSSFYRLYHDSIPWNNAVYKFIIRKKYPDLVVKEVSIESDWKPAASFVKSSTNYPLFKKIYRFLVRIASDLFSLKNLFIKYFIFEAYISKLNFIALHLNLFQVPYLTKRSKFTSQANYNINLRYSLVKLASRYLHCFTPDERIITELCLLTLPTCYLEDFEELLFQSKSCYKFMNPKVVYTANAFDTDELFKVWVALRDRLRTSYVVGQHGNNYHTHIYSPMLEEQLADKFITWGNAGIGANYVNGFILKTLKMPKKSNPETGDLLLMLPPCELSPLDINYRYSRYYQVMESTHDLASSLDPKVQEFIRFRLHSFQSRFDLGEIPFKNFPDPKHYSIASGKTLLSSIKSSRLVVHCYDSTGLLETFASDIPSVGFLPYGVQDINSSALKDYQDLSNAGLLYFSVDSLKRHIDVHWNDILLWWTSCETKRARLRFCEKYARKSARPMRRLSKILKSL